MDIIGPPVVVTLVVAVLLALGTLLFAPLRDRIRLWLNLHASPSGISLTINTDLTHHPNLKRFAPMQFYLPGRERESLVDYPGKGWVQWAHGIGGIEVGHLTVLITIQAHQDAAIAIEPPVLHWHRHDIPPGQAISPEGMGDGVDLNPRYYTFSIQGEDYSREYSDPDSKEVRSPSFTLQKWDTESLLVFIHVDKGMVRWSLDIPMIVNGRRQVKKVTNHGKDFTTIGAEGLRFMLWVGSGWILSG